MVRLIDGFKNFFGENSRLVKREPLAGNSVRLTAELGLTIWEISLSYTQDQAIAFAVAMLP